ncbi:MAG: HEAT repeat domain-containing protein, partial [Cyanobacteriota bacterium]|nr:HEAT repeat domain-containing protein [Cyanobacteriota bacterium]
PTPLLPYSPSHIISIQPDSISPLSVDEVIQELEKYALNPEHPRASFVITTAAWCNLSRDYVPILCQILNSESHNGLHENVIEILDELRDERAIPVLSKALTYRWSYDFGLSVPKKALLALAEIETPEAMTIIKEATQSSEELIRDDANLFLENLSD